MNKNKILSAAVLALFLGCTDIPDELREEAGNRKYNYCVFVEQYKCQAGSFTTSNCSGQLSQDCPYYYNSSSSVGCGSIVFNPSTSFCYDGYIYDKCNGMEYNPTTYICQGLVAIPAECGSQKYNPLEQGCCAYSWERIFSLATESCCDDRQIFSLENKRCQNKVVETKCGSGWYNDDEYDLRCQNGVVETRCWDNRYNPADNWYNAADKNLRCESGVVETKCGNDWYKVVDKNLRCKNNVMEAECGTNNWYNYSTQFCHTDNTIHYKCDGSDYNASTQFCSNGTVKTYGSMFSEDKFYKTVVIGNQTWMAENMNYETANGSMCWDNDEANCTIYGRLYNWSTAMGVCPSGWHLPSDDEWTTLTSFVGSSAGTKLKANSSLWRANAGTDDYGFSALPGGYGNTSGTSTIAGNIGGWWSSTEYDASIAYGRFMSYEYASVNKNFGNKEVFFSVRCVQD